VGRTARIPRWLGATMIVNNRVVVATSEGNEGPGYVQAFDLTSGAEQWCHATKGSPVSTLPAGDLVLLLEGHGTVHVYDPATGEERERGEVATVSSPTFCGAAIAVNSEVIVAAGTIFRSNDHIQPQKVIGYGEAEGGVRESDQDG